MEKSMKIIPPEGYEVDREHSTFECIKFKPINPPLPTTWEEFCKTHPVKQEEAYINNCGLIGTVGKGSRLPNVDKNVLPSKKMAEAILALCQLIQLRDCYNDGWQPNWASKEFKYVLCPKNGSMQFGMNDTVSRILAFKTKELREKFLENFKDLIEIAKPLL